MTSAASGQKARIAVSFLPPDRASVQVRFRFRLEMRARMPQSWHIASRKPLCDGLLSFVGFALMVPLSAMSLRADPLGAQLERQLPLLLERHGVARA